MRNLCGNNLTNYLSLCRKCFSEEEKTYRIDKLQRFCPLLVFSCFKVILKPARCEAQIRVVTFEAIFSLFFKSNVAKENFVHSKSIFYFKKCLNLSDFFFKSTYLGPYLIFQTSILKSLYLLKWHPIFVYTALQISKNVLQYIIFW